MASARLWLFLAAVAVAAAGLQLGAHVQKEEYFEPTSEAADRDSNRASDTLVLLTALLCATGVALAAAALSRRPWLQRLLPAFAAGAGAYVLVVLAQMAWPNVTIIQLEGSDAFADLSINPMVAHARAAPSLLVPLLSIAVLACGSVAWGLARLWRPRAEPTLRGLLKLQMAAIAAAAPLAAAGAAGAIRLMARIADEPGAGAYQVLLPLQALALVALLGAALQRARHTASALAEPRLVASAEESQAGLLRIEWAALGLLGATAILAQLFPPVGLEELREGVTFGITLRVHSQLLGLAAFPLLTGLALQRPIQAALSRHRTPAVPGPNPTGLAIACAGGLVLAIAMAFLSPWTTWACLAAALPPALWAAWRLGPTLSAPSLVTVGLLLWGLGNSVSGSYTFSAYAELDLHRDTGVLALWRVLAATALAITAARAVRGLARSHRGRDATAAAALVGAAAALVVLIDLPLSAWIAHRGSGASLAVGSFIHSLDPIVRTSLRVLDAALLLLAGRALARLLRPDWFAKRPGDSTTVLAPEPAYPTPPVATRVLRSPPSSRSN